VPIRAPPARRRGSLEDDALVARGDGKHGRELARKDATPCGGRLSATMEGHGRRIGDARRKKKKPRFLKLWQPALPIPIGTVVDAGPAGAARPVALNCRDGEAIGDADTIIALSNSKA